MLNVKNKTLPVKSWNRTSKIRHFSESRACKYRSFFLLRQTVESVSCDTLTSQEENAADHELTDEKRELLSLYHNTINDERVDHDLVIALIHHIQESYEETGAILVFLPGYDDIVQLR